MVCYDASKTFENLWFFFFFVPQRFNTKCAHPKGKKRVLNNKKEEKSWHTTAPKIEKYLCSQAYHRFLFRAVKVNVSS